MPKIVEVQGLGNVEFPDSMSDAQITSAIQSDILPKIGAANAPVGRGGVLASGAEAFLTGLTDVPEGIAGLFNPRPEETRAGKFSQAARSGIQSILGINPEAQPTTAETAASALGSVGSFLLPFVGQEMAATRLLGGAGEAAAAARSIGKAATATQAAGLGVEQQIQSIKDKEATGQLLTDEQRLKAQRLGGAIGLTDLIPLRNYMGPLEAILAKVPLSKVGPAKRVVGEAVQKALLSATEEGAQEAFSQAAQNLVAQGIYDPSVNITDGLLANAGAGGFAGGTLDVILQLVAGHKAGRGVKAQEQYLKKRAEEAKAGGDEAVRADAQSGLESIRQIAPLGNISVQREAVLDKETGKTSDAYHLVGEDGTKLASFLSPDAAVLAGQQYEKDARGLAKFNAPTVGEMASKSILEDTAPEEKAAGKVEAQALKQEDAFKPSPTATTTTPEGQAATGATIEGLSTETGVPPAELTPSTKPQRGRIRRLQAKAEEVVPPTETPPPAPFEGLKAPEQPFPRPPERMTPERELEMRAAGLSDADLLAAGLGQPNQFSITPEEQTPQAPQAETTAVPPPPVAPAPPTTPPKLTLDAVRNALPKDRFGNPDMGVLVDAISKIKKGKPVPWDLLTDAQKTTIAKRVAPSLFPKPGVAAKAAPPTGTAAPFVPRTSVNFRPSEATAEGRAAAKVFDERMDTVVKEVNKALAPLGLKNVRVQFSNFLKAKTGSGEQVFPQGYVNNAGDVIFLATNIYDPNLSAEQNAQKVVEIMNHEVIHSLVNLGLFKPGEIKTLFDAVQSVNYPGSKFTYFDRAVGTYGTVYKNADGSPNMEMIVEEGVAEMFRDWNAGRLKLVGKPQGLFQRMLEFIKRLFRGMKNAKVEDVFRSIKAGEFGAREARPAAAGETKFATAPQERDDAFRALADAQRNRPETAMLRTHPPLYEYPSGNALHYILEHVGDLTHRMAEHPDWNTSRGLELVRGKINKGLSVLSNAVDMERIKAIPDLPELKTYADEHAKLPVYNQAQRAARDAAVALGRRDFAGAERNLRTLKSMIDIGSYVDVASSYNPNLETAAGEAKLSGTTQADKDNIAIKVCKPNGDCYKSAYRDVVKNGGKLVHGTVTSNGKTFSHAWAERDGLVHDYSSGNEYVLPAEVYRDAVSARNITEYDKTDAMKSAVKSGNFGPWDGGRPAAGETKFALSPSWASSGAPSPGVDSNNSRGNNPYRVSQRLPTAGRATENALEEDLAISLDVLRRDPEAFKRNISLVRRYDGFPFVPGETAEQTARRYKNHIVQNLLALYDAVDDSVKKRSKLWYVGARRITTEWAKKYNLPDTAIASVMANLSPQKDWFQNVSLAERVLDIVTGKRNFRYTKDMDAVAKIIYAKPKFKKNLASIRGKTFGELTNSIDKAIWLRIYDETYLDKGHRIISPEGYFMGYATNLDGKNTKIAWNSNVMIAKAIESIENPTKENINNLLGEQHKVRNFYNNILSPNSAGGDVTIDTHAVAAALWRPLSGSSLEVDHNFGSTSVKGRAGTSNSSITGAQGIYGLYADAYREAAEKRGVKPREMQSITWEAVRSLFPDTLKSNKKTVEKIKKLWNEHKRGRKTAAQVRKELRNEYGKNISVTAWTGSAGGVDARQSDSSYAGELSRPRLSGESARVVGGSGKSVAGRNQEQVNKDKDTAKAIARRASQPGADVDALASAANTAVKNAVSKLSIAPQSAPMPPALSAANDTLFAKDTSPRTIGEKLMGLFGGLGTANGRTRIMDTIRVNFVHKEGQFNKIEQQAYIGGVLPEFEQRFKEYSAVAAMDMRNRASHYTVETMQNGAPVIKMIDPRTGQTFRAGQGGDANSMYMEVEPDPENTPAKIFEILLTSGPGGTSLVDHFRSYAISQVAKKRIAEGKEVPAEITPQYMAEADQLGVTYPQIVDAFTRYQNFNAKLMKAALDAGVIDRAGYDRFLDGMNYYSMYRQFEEEPIVPGTSPSLGSQIKVREYAGGEAGNLMANPITAMMYNVAFWNNAILQNIASQKALRVGKLTGLMKELKVSVNANGTKTIEQPDVNAGFFDKVFYTNINGVATPFATKDPLLAVGLMSSPQANLEGIFKLFGMPTSFLREMVTRDPGFMIANLLRDSVSTWVLAGSGAKPHETFIGLKNALLKTGSYQNLKNFGVIGSFDEAQKSPEKFVAGLSKKIIKKQGGAEIMDSLTWAWDSLEKVSEASDAATRIAVYDAAKRAGESDFTAAYRSLSIMNFSRSGASAGLRIYTKLVPFLNARIQGFDVLYTGLKAGVNVLAGKEQTEFDRQRGTAVLYRGMGLMAAAMALALLNEDDEDYKQLPQYIKDSNLLIPVGGGKFLSVPKPFEAGLLFMTVPTTLYDMAAGNRSMRSGLGLFYNQFSSTFGFNPTPQFALPIYENITNRDFYTGLPLVSPGQEKLDASLQYNASTSYVARGIGKALKYSPMGYNIETGRFEGVSPILVDNLISGYGGPIASYIGMGIGGITSAFGTDNQGLPVAASNLPVIRRFFIDAQDKQPQAAADAYDLYQQVDKVTRTVSRLKKMGDIEALKEYRAENIDILRVGKQVRKMADNLNNLRAQLRRLEADKTMSGEEKLAKMRELRSREIALTNRINEINQKLGR